MCVSGGRHIQQLAKGKIVPVEPTFNPAVIGLGGSDNVGSLDIGHDHFSWNNSAGESRPPILHSCPVLRCKIFGTRRRKLGAQQGRYRRGNRSGPTLSQRFADANGQRYEHRRSVTTSSSKEYEPKASHYQHRRAKAGDQQQKN
jgi:hypothetical protein